jgi:arylsulfatase
LEAAGVPAPTTVNGIEQMPIHGVSFAYTFDDANAAERHTQQYFEIFGNRAMYKDGWIASCKLDRIPWELDPQALAKFAPGVYDPDNDRWELYNIRHDFSQACDVAQEYPEKLNELKALFLQEAEKYQVLPLLAGFSTFFGFLPTAGAARTRFTFYPGVANIGPGMIPHVYGTSYAIEADLVIPNADVEGAIVANADDLGGFSLYVQNGKLHHTYAFLGIWSRTLSSQGPLPTGPVIVRFEFIADTPKIGTGGLTRLFVNGKNVAQGRLDQTVPARFSAYACMDIGADNRKPVSHTYKSPFAFTGTINSVTFDLEPTPKSAAEKQEIETAQHQVQVALGVTG